MHPKKHIFYGLIFAVFCYFSFSDIGIVESLVIWFSSWFLIDLDHPIRYSIKTGNFNPLRFWRWSEERDKRWKEISPREKVRYKKPVYLFHNFETLIILTILSQLYAILFYVVIGFVFHLIFDYYQKIKNNGDVFVKMSIIYVLLLNLGKKEFK